MTKPGCPARAGFAFVDPMPVFVPHFHRRASSASPENALRQARSGQGPVAQRLEPAAHNGLVAGSSPAGPTPQQAQLLSFWLNDSSGTNYRQFALSAPTSRLWPTKPALRFWSVASKSLSNLSYPLNCPTQNRATIINPVSSVARRARDPLRQRFASLVSSAISTYLVPAGRRAWGRLSELRKISGPYLIIPARGSPLDNRAATAPRSAPEASAKCTSRREVTLAQSGSYIPHLMPRGNGQKAPAVEAFPRGHCKALGRVRPTPEARACSRTTACAPTLGPC